jgi:pimeloyl-ACP methyl ester carboxylesterase
MSWNAATAHPDEVMAAHRTVLDRSRAQHRYIDVDGRQVHVIEIGEGPPLVLLHGTNTSALLLEPLLERLQGVRAIAIDRPGLGLSDPLDVPRERFADAAVQWLDGLLDALRLDKTALAGNSMGGTWALWYALANPDRIRRLVLLGAAPLLPETRVPAPLRVMATPKVGEFVQRLMPSTPKTVVQMMGFMGEKETIADYPDQVDALVAAGNDPVASKANLAELRAVAGPFGFRRRLRLHADELGRLSVPTLLVWGKHDPVGGAKVAQAIAELIPEARLELLPAGHGPWLGHADRTANLVARFMR